MGTRTGSACAGRCSSADPGIVRAGITERRAAVHRSGGRGMCRLRPRPRRADGAILAGGRRFRRRGGGRRLRRPRRRVEHRRRRWRTSSSRIPRRCSEYVNKPIGAARIPPGRPQAAARHADDRRDRLGGDLRGGAGDPGAARQDGHLEPLAPPECRHRGSAADADDDAGGDFILRARALCHAVESYLARDYRPRARSPRRPRSARPSRARRRSPISGRRRRWNSAANTSAARCRTGRTSRRARRCRWRR